MSAAYLYLNSLLFRTRYGRDPGSSRSAGLQIFDYFVNFQLNVMSVQVPYDRPIFLAGMKRTCLIAMTHAWSKVLNPVD